MVSGVHFAANLDGSANVLSMANKNSLFNLAHQRLLRDAMEQPFATVHVRGIGRRARVTENADVLIGQRYTSAGEVDLDNEALWRFLDQQGLRAAMVDGRWENWGYENHFALQSRYMEQSRGKSFWTVWVPPATRLEQRFQASNRQLLAQLTSMGLEPQERSLRDRMLDDRLFGHLSVALEAGIREYQETFDSVVLAELLAANKSRHFEALIDRGTQQVYLLVGQNQQSLSAAFLLGSPEGPGRRVRTTELALVLDEFVQRREPWIVLRRPS